MAPSIQRLAILSGTALLAIAAVSTAMAGGVGDGPLTGQQQSIFTMPAGPIINRVGTYTPPALIGLVRRRGLNSPKNSSIETNRAM